MVQVEVHLFIYAGRINSTTQTDLIFMYLKRQIKKRGGACILSTDIHGHRMFISHFYAWVYFLALSQIGGYHS